MAASLFTNLRRIAGYASIPLLFALCTAGAAAGQNPAPLVIASAPAGLNHPTGWQVIQQTAITKNGDWLVEEYPDGGLFEFPANGGPMITLVPLYGVGSKNGYQNPLLLLDPAQNIYLGGNWNNCLLEFPYDAATDSWPTLSLLSSSNNSASQCGTTPPTLAQYGIFGFAPYYFQPWGIALGVNNNLIVGSQNSGNFIFSMNVQGAWSSPSVPQTGSSTSKIISGMTKRPISIAVDPEGNVYFVEDSNGLPGVYEIPASVVAGGTAAALSSDAGLTRVDPNLPGVTGVVTDAAGNLYISDSQQGVYVVPNPSGTPDTAGAYLLSPVPASGEAAIDPARHILYLPTSQKQSNGQADVAKVGYSYAELGSSNVGTAAAVPGTVAFAFNGSATPASFEIVEAGKSHPDFALTGGTCAAGTAYAANASCNETVSFTPGSVGSISAKLLMLDASNNILSSIMLHGTGVGANVQVSPGVEATLGSGLQTPSQVAVDAAGNVYVADPGQAKVLMFATGSSTPASVGTGLTSPTGVAVDGAGDVFIADSGTGSVYEVPVGPSGLNAAGQWTVVGGLGGNLSLAADSLGDLYVSDPSDNQVVRVSGIGGTGLVGSQSVTMMKTGFTQPTAVAVDANHNLYVIDQSNLFEVAGGTGAPATLMSSLSGATGLAVDASGAVYITTTSATERIPFVGGALAPGSATTVAADVNGATSVALDSSGNVYLAPAAGGALTTVSTNGTLTLATPATLTSSTDAIFTVTNNGNSPLTVTNYTSSNAVDFTAADTTSGGCEAGSPVAPGGSCTVDVNFNPGAGEQGALSSQIGVVSNAVNIPVTVSASGVGLTLANSATAETPGAAPEVVNTPISVTVAPKSGTGVAPTGTVTVTFTSWKVVSANGGGVVTPIPVSVSSNLVNGQATFTLAPVLAGNQNIVVNYSGDRVYARSTTSMAVTIAKSQITGIALDPNPPSYLPFVLESGNVSGSIPYDGSQSYWQYTLPVTVNTAAGVPTGTLTFMDDSTTCPPGTSATGQGAAICALANYKGQACPTAGASAAVVQIQNNGKTPTGAAASPGFQSGCLQMPQNVTYTPVISTHWVTPVYSGDVNFIGFTGNQGTLFQALRSPEVLITSSPSSLTVAKGSSVSTTLTLTSILGYGYAGKNSLLNDYNFPVTMACDNLPPHSVCTFGYPSTVSPAQPSAPNSVQIPCTGTTAAADNCATGTVQVTINTNVTVGTTTTSSNAAVASVTLASLFGFGMIGLFIRRKALASHRLLLMGILVVVGCALAVSLTACNTTNLSPNAVLTTPPGTYAVTVTADQVGYQCVASGPIGSNCTTPSGGTGQSVFGSQNQVSVPFYIPVTVQ